MFGRRRDRNRPAGADPAVRGASPRRGHKLPGEVAAPEYRPSIALRSIDGHLVRTGQDVYAWYRLASQRWSFRSDSQRQDLIQAIAG